jgi:RHS repeat-associated protein
MIFYLWEGVKAHRFGFNGKENDNEIKGTGNQQDYGMRIYDPRLGRFLSVDPLTKDYPWYSPYQFAGNSPIKFIDLDGLEPEKNPADYEGVAEKAGTEVIWRISSCSSQCNSTENNSTPYDKQKLIGTSDLTGKSDYITDTNEKSANNFNLWVSNSSVFKVDESNSNDFNNYEAFVVNHMLQNFRSGVGPENYEFPTNGVISSQFLDSDILKEALVKFTANGYFNEQVSFGAKYLIKDTWRNGTIFNVSGFVGSAIVTMNPTSEGVAVKIFNVTSLTSGSLGKELFKESNYPKSFVRDQNSASPTPYSNISQTYNLLLSQKLIDKIIAQ